MRFDIHSYLQYQIYVRLTCYSYRQVGIAMRLLTLTSQLNLQSKQHLHHHNMEAGIVWLQTQIIAILVNL